MPLLGFESGWEENFFNSLRFKEVDSSVELFIMFNYIFKITQIPQKVCWRCGLKVGSSRPPSRSARTSSKILTTKRERKRPPTVIFIFYLQISFKVTFASYSSPCATVCHSSPQ
jgi:hypothetical protein